MDKQRKKVEIFLSEYGKLIFLFFTVFLILVLLLKIYSLTGDKNLKVTFLNVGQGDAILVTTPSGKQVLIDGGPTDKVMEELADHVSYFDRSLDVLVATHPDADHITGLIPVLEKYRVDTFVTSNVQGDTGVWDTLTEKVKQEGALISTAKKGDVIDFGDGVVAYILYPTNVVAKDTNEGSVSLVLRYGEQSFLLSGDLSTSNERFLIQESLPQQVTVFKAGHHGSRTSSGEVLLSYIRPEYAVVSAGENNDYGHPHPETLERFTKYAKETLSTVDSGAITFITDGRMMEVQTQK